MFFQKDIETMPRKQLEELQLERLRHTVDYCYNNVAFYHKKLGDAGITDASKIKTDNVRAIEERLKCLGYFYGEADDEWDKRTVHAINLFCRDNNLPQIGSVCKWELIEQIDHATQNLKYKYVAEYKPLDKAIELAEEFAASDKKAVRTDNSKINFNGN